MHRTKPEGKGLQTARVAQSGPAMVLLGAGVTLTTPTGRPALVLQVGKYQALLRYLDVPERQTVELTLAAMRRWPGVYC